MSDMIKKTRAVSFIKDLRAALYFTMSDIVHNQTQIFKDLFIYLTIYIVCTYYFIDV